MSKVKDRLKAKLAAKNSQKAIHLSPLAQKITDILKIQNKSKFKKEFKSCIDQIETHIIEHSKYKAVYKSELNLLENLFDKYVAILKPKTIKLQDLKTLSTCFSQKFLIKDTVGMITIGLVKDLAPFGKLINKIKKDITNSKFHNRPLDDWDNILVSINNDFISNIEKPTTKDLFYMTTGYSEKGLLKVAYDSYQKILTKMIC